MAVEAPVERPTARAGTGRDRFRLVVTGLFVLHLAIRAVVFGSGFYYGDDYPLQGRGVRLPLWSSDLLLHVHSGHLMPGGFLLSGFAGRAAPFNYWLLLAFVLVLQAVASYVTIRLLIELFGRRTLTLAPIVVALFSPLTLLPYSWWAVGVTLLPVQAAVAGASLAALRYSRTRSVWALAGAVAAQLAGLLFLEKGVLAPIVAFAVVWVATDPGMGLRASLSRTARRCLPLWIVMAAVNVGYLVLYANLATEGFRDVRDSAQAVTLASNALVRGFVPSLMGGPITWLPHGDGTALADPPLWFVVLSIHLLAALVLVGCVRRPAARRAWGALAGYVGLEVIALVLGRVDLATDPALGLALRYTASSIVLAVVAVGASLMSTREYRTPTDDAAALARWPRSVRPWVVLAAAGYGYLAVSVASAATLAPALVDNESRRWTTTLLRSSGELSAELGRPVPLFDSAAPEFVYGGLGHPYNQYSWVLAPLADVQITTSSDQLFVISDAGRIVPAEVDGIASRQGPDGGCNWAVDGDGGRVLLTGPQIEWQHTVRIGYFVGEDTESSVRLGTGAAVPFHAEAGAGEVFVDLWGGGSVLTFAPTTNGQTLCLDARVGKRVAAE